MRKLLARLARLLRPTFSTRRHPLQVAVQDAIVAAGVGLAVQYLLRYAAGLYYGSYWPLDTTDIVIFTAVPAVLAGASGLLGSLIIRRSPYLRRSVRKTVRETVSWMLVTTTTVWLVCGLGGTVGVLSLEAWVAFLGLIGVGTGNAGIRIFGFYTPRATVLDN